MNYYCCKYTVFFLLFYFFKKITYIGDILLAQKGDACLTQKYDANLT